MTSNTKMALLLGLVGLGIGLGIYTLMRRRGGQLGDLLPGGKGAGRRPSDFDPRQLKVGTAIEMEHTNDRRVAREIAMDHLTENPRYYTMLCRFEPEEPACRWL